MIEYIRGTLVEASPAAAVVEAAQIGYLLQITSATYGALQQKHEAQLFVHEVIREDAHELYGFATREERALFRLLISVSGVGPSTARVALSAYTVGEIVQAIERDDSTAIRRIKGIGPKTAGRIVLELRGKLDGLTSGLERGTVGQAAAGSAIMEEALAALSALGVARTAARQALELVIAEKVPGADRVEVLVKEALRRL